MLSDYETCVNTPHVQRPIIFIMFEMAGDALEVVADWWGGHCDRACGEFWPCVTVLAVLAVD